MYIKVREQSFICISTSHSHPKIFDIFPFNSNWYENSHLLYIILYAMWSSIPLCVNNCVNLFLFVKYRTCELRKGNFIRQRMLHGIFVFTNTFIFLQTVGPDEVSVWSDEQPHNYTTNLSQLYDVIRKWRELFETYTSEDKMSR